MTQEEPDELSDVDWIRQQIELAQSRERMDYIASLIRMAVQDQEPWTRGEQTMKSLREQWLTKWNLFKEQKRRMSNAASD